MGDACELLGGAQYCNDAFELTEQCPAECSQLTRIQACSPLIRGFVSPLGAVLPIYTLVAALLVAMVSVAAKNIATSYSGEPSRYAEPRLLRRMPSSMVFANGMRVAGYADSALGDACFALIVCFTVVLFLVYLLIIADFYWACEFTGPDNCCLQGKHPLLGDYDVNSKTFFGWWVTTLCWAGTLGCHQTKLRNWCRSHVSLAEASYVWIAVPSRVEDLSVKRSCAIGVASALYRAFSRKQFEETVRVHSTRDGTRFFVFQCQRYVIDVEAAEIRKSDPVLKSHLQLYSGGRADSISGLSSEEHQEKLAFLGPNLIPFEVDTVGDALCKEFLSGFYLYQLLIYSAWIWSSWLLVGGLLASVVVLSGALNIRLARRNQRRIQQLTAHESQVMVKRDNAWVEVDAVQLVPGDVIQLAEGTIPCDCVIIQGEAATDESGLTGESMPVRKVALPPFAAADAGLRPLAHSGAPMDQSVEVNRSSSPLAKDAEAIAASADGKEDAGDPIHPRHRLFSGSALLYAAQPDNSATNSDASVVVCVVCATGISTTKGQLVSAILFPTKLAFSYDIELAVVIGILGLYAAACCSTAVVLLQNNGSEMPFVTTWVYAVFTASQVLSPLLPVALRTGEQNASARLATNSKIFCIDPKRIAISGKVRVFAFDKTGTLTQPGLEFQAAHWSTAVNGAVESGSGGSEPRFVGSPQQNQDGFFATNRAPAEVIRGMACCHAVSIATGLAADGTEPQQLMGNEVEVKMFGATGWRIQPVSATNDGIATGGRSAGISRVVGGHGSGSLDILRRFEFSHDRMTMSVIARDPFENATYVFCKGAYERVGQLCEPSTLPMDYTTIAEMHARQGNYVLALGMRRLTTDDEKHKQLLQEAVSRDAVESQLEFVSLLLFRNSLKPDSREAIEALKAGNVRPIMVTGDTAGTAAFIAQECGMLESSKRLLCGDVDAGNDTVIWRPLRTDASVVDTNPQPAQNADSDEILSTVQVLQILSASQNASTGLVSDGAGRLNSARSIELAMTGNCFSELERQHTAGPQSILDDLLLHTRIFARVSPAQKSAVVSLHMARGLVVGMCGDGGNDCGALRRAHVGIALSEAEASLVAPFTSASKSCISCVDLLREGRGALATSFASYKFLMQYGTAFSAAKLLAYYYGVILCAVHYIIVDVALIITLTFTITLARPVPTLGPDRPTASLFGATTMGSVVGQHAIYVATLVVAIHWMRMHDDYIQWGPSDPDAVPPMPVDAAEGRKWWYLGTCELLYHASTRTTQSTRTGHGAASAPGVAADATV